MKCFKFFDFANSGEVNFPTFSRAIAKMGVVVEDEDLQDFFGYYDMNDNGTLDYNEFSSIIFQKAGNTGSTQPAFKGNQDPTRHVQAIRDKLKQRGARGMIGMQRVFKIMDDDCSKSLSFEEFRKGIKDFKIDIPEESIKIVYNAFDMNRDGSISYDEFLRVIKGPLTPARRAFV